MRVLANALEPPLANRHGAVLVVDRSQWMGAGNTVAHYIPEQDYLTMPDEGRRWSCEHFGVRSEPAAPLRLLRPRCGAGETAFRVSETRRLLDGSSRHQNHQRR